MMAMAKWKKIFSCAAVLSLAFFQTLLAQGSWTAPLSLSPSGYTLTGGNQTFKFAQDSHGNAVAVWALENGTNTVLQAAYKPAGGAWQLPTGVTDTLSTAGYNVFGADESYSVAIGGNGEVVVAWLLDLGGGNSEIQSAYRTPTTPWQKPVDVNDTLSPLGINAIYPYAVMNALGEAYVVWQLNSSPDALIQVAYKPAGSGTFQKPGATDSLSPAGYSAFFFTNNYYFQPIALDDQGNVVAVWAVNNGTNAEIQAAYRPSGGAWHLPPITEFLSSAGVNSAYAMTEMNLAGNAVVVWISIVGGNSVLYSASTTTFGSWTAPLALSSSAYSLGASNQAYKFAQDSHGNVVAVWLLDNGVNTVLQGAYKPVGEAWQIPTGVTDILSTAGHDVIPSPESFSVAIGGNGEAVATWVIDLGGGNSEIQSAYRTATTPWQKPVDINDALSPLGFNALYPYVVMNTSGEAYVVWRLNNTSNLIIQEAYKPAGSGTFQKPGVTDSLSPAGYSTLFFTSNFFFRPIALDSQGNVVVVWATINGSIHEIQAAYRSSGGAWHLPPITEILSPAGVDSANVMTTMNAIGSPEVFWLISSGSDLILQVADGINLFAPSPPSNLSGYQQSLRYLKQTDLVNIISWTKSTSETAVAYWVYRDGVKLARVASTGADRYTYRDHNRRKGATYLYTITAVNSEGQESPATAEIRVP